jgi:hypothetical protein
VNARSVTVCVEVAVPPATAFTIFTEDISRWWRRGTPYWNDRERGKAVRFEPRLGGRLIEVWDLATWRGSRPRTDHGVGAGTLFALHLAPTELAAWARDRSRGFVSGIGDRHDRRAHAPRLGPDSYPEDH